MPARARAAVSVVVAAAVLCLCPIAARAATPQSVVPTGPTPNLVRNGQFAIGGLYLTVSSDANGTGADIAGWVVGGGGVFVDSASYLQSPPASSQSVALAGAGGPGTITQTVATKAGTTYLLQWYGAGEPAPGSPAVKTMNVLWDKAVVAAPKYNTADHTYGSMGWSQGSVVVTATGTSSTMEFADSMTANVTYGPLVGDVSLGADARLYVPARATIAGTGTIVAIVDNATGSPLGGTALSVYLYAVAKTAPGAPAQLLASSPVVNGQAVLRLKLAASQAGKTVPAYAVLRGGAYIPVVKELTLKIT